MVDDDETSYPSATLWQTWLNPTKASTAHCYLIKISTGLNSLEIVGLEAGVRFTRQGQVAISYKIPMIALRFEKSSP